MKKQHNNTRLICQLSAAAALVLSANAMADDAFSADSKWMTGDWGGERTKLIEQGIDIKADYVGEVGGNLHGGYNNDKTALISKAVDLLIQARQIHFFGLGASAPVAMDALHKFFRFNLAVTAHADVLMQRMIASVAHTGELFVIISYTGRTRELVEVARIARSNGASVLGVTAENSPLAKASTVSLNIPLPEDTDIYMPMTSRIIQLTVLDVLATGMTLRRGVDFQPHLRKIKESLNDSRYPVGDEFN